MGFYSPARLLPQRFRLVLSSFLQSPVLPFANVLPEGKLHQAFDEEGVDFASDEDDVYTPAVTLWAFLSQVLFKDEQRSCAAAVARVVVLLVALGKAPPSDNTGAYCRARAKLPERVLRRLVEDVAELYHKRWHVEVYFRTLKSNCRIESLRFEDIERFERCLAVYMIVARRTLYTVRLGREYPDLDCEAIFEPDEWRSVYRVIKNEYPPSTQGKRI